MERHRGTRCRDAPEVCSKHSLSQGDYDRAMWRTWHADGLVGEIAPQIETSELCADSNPIRSVWNPSHDGHRQSARQRRSARRQGGGHHPRFFARHVPAARETAVIAPYVVRLRAQTVSRESKDSEPCHLPSGCISTGEGRTYTRITRPRASTTHRVAGTSEQCPNPPGSREIASTSLRRLAFVLTLSPPEKRASHYDGRG